MVRIPMKEPRKSLLFFSLLKYQLWWLNRDVVREAHSNDGLNNFGGFKKMMMSCAQIMYRTSTDFAKFQCPCVDRA